jgi:hypothetical protein
MTKTTRENFKKYRKLYYKKPKRRTGHLKYSISALMIWQLIVFQLVFSFNLRTAIAADAGTEKTSISADTSASSNATSEKEKTESSDLSPKKDDLKKITDGDNVNALDGEMAKINDKNPELPDKKRKNNENSQDEKSTATDSNIDQEKPAVEKNDTAAPSGTVDSNADGQTEKTDEKTPDQDTQLPAVADNSKKLDPANPEEIAASEKSESPDPAPENLWKTCDLHSDLSKMKDKSDGDECKKKSSCSEIKICLQVKIEVENKASVSNNVSTIADTGENGVNASDVLKSEESPSDIIASAVADTPEIHAAENQGDFEDQNIASSTPVSDGAETENPDQKTDKADEQKNSQNVDVSPDIQSPNTEEKSNSSSASIETGEAVAVSDVVNEVNTNVIGQNGVETVENIYGDYTGDINLLDSFNSLLENGKKLNEENQFALGAADISIDNKAVVDNNVTTVANTGQNEIDNGSDNGSSTITTGDALAAADVVNIVNTNIIGNNFLFAVVNVFGNWVGDLIVPGQGLLTVPDSGQTANLVVDVQNDAKIENNIQTSASTGENKVESGGGSAAQTGAAVANSTVVNQVGTTVVGNNWFFLAINNMGNWVGNVLNWNSQLNGYDTVFSFDFDEKKNPQEGGLADWLTKIFIKNDAKVENNVTTEANTGENQIESEGGAASLKTGNAYAFSKVYNLVNNNFIGNNWMFAVVNIFGTWKGNVNFVQPESPVVPPVGGETGNIPAETAGNALAPIQTVDEMTSKKNLNSSLALSRSVSKKKINVGEIAKHILVLKNTGDSAIHDVVIRDGITNKKGNAGDYFWKVGKLDPGEKAVVEYKLLINPDASSGKYKNQASALGYDENGGEVRSNESGTEISVGKADAAVTTADLNYYTYYTYYTYFRRPVVPVESNLPISEAETAEPDGKVLGTSSDFWNRPAPPDNFNPGWIILPAAVLLAMRFRRKNKKPTI